MSMLLMLFEPVTERTPCREGKQEILGVSCLYNYIAHSKNLELNYMELIDQSNGISVPNIDSGNWENAVTTWGQLRL